MELKCQVCGKEIKYLPRRKYCKVCAKRRPDKSVKWKEEKAWNDEFNSLDEKTKHDMIFSRALEILNER